MATPEQLDIVAPDSDRSAQRFPRLRQDQLEVVRRFANIEATRFAPGENIFQVGERGVPAWFLLEDSAEVFGRDGLDQEISLQRLESGQFTGELHQLTGRPTFAGALAGTDGCVALPLNAERLRALIVGSAEVGELLMRALILRRVGLLERDVGPVLLGRAGSADLLRLQAFLTRNAYPHFVLDCASERGRQLIKDLALPPGDLPILVCPSGRVLRRPSNEETGIWLGITPTLKGDDLYDVAVVGAGPAGLATAVYAASEGLSVLVLDAEVPGGQAGASARIENYLGFPTGISGQALTGRAFSQAQKFGAQVAIPLVVTRIRCDGGSGRSEPVELTLSKQGPVRARTVVVASGARYRRAHIVNLKPFEGRSVHYWASAVEAKLCSGEQIGLVGGGNSAGQAAVFLAPHIRRLTMVVRGEGLEASMSRYLIDRIRMLDNVDVLVHSELAELHGEPLQQLHGATVRNRQTLATFYLPIRHVFVFTGAEPNTEWLHGCLALDEKGYILTGFGTETGASAPVQRSLQTSLPRVFATGDVRSGSTKRVASAVGEGAAVVAQIHSVLGALRSPSNKDLRSHLDE
jgi:thioredoxin reductase (NADPH)